MASNSTQDCLSRAESDGSSAVEYSLYLSDYHALDMFLYDTILRKQVGFRLRFYVANALVGAVISVLGGVLVRGAAIFLAGTSVPRASDIGGLAALLFFTVMLIGFLPGGFWHEAARRTYEERFWRHRHRLLRRGLQKSRQNCRVVMTAEGFTECLQSREASGEVEIMEGKLSKVSWLAVSSIDVTARHAFFRVEKANLYFTTPGYLILPRLAFDSEASFHGFVDRARVYRDAAYQEAATSFSSRTPRDTRITR